MPEKEAGEYLLRPKGDEDDAGPVLRRRRPIRPTGHILLLDERPIYANTSDEIILLDEPEDDDEHELSDDDVQFLEKEYIPALLASDDPTKYETVHAVQDAIRLARRQGPCFTCHVAQGPRAPPFPFADGGLGMISPAFPKELREALWGTRRAPPVTGLDDQLQHDMEAAIKGITHFVGEWIIPRPDQSYESARESVDILFEGIERGEGLRIAQGACGTLSHSILTVVECVPLAGNAAGKLGKLAGKGSKAGKATTAAAKVGGEAVDVLTNVKPGRSVLVTEKTLTEVATVSAKAKRVVTFATREEFAKVKQQLFRAIGEAETRDKLPAGFEKIPDHIWGWFRRQVEKAPKKIMGPKTLNEFAQQQQKLGRKYLKLPGTPPKNVGDWCRKNLQDFYNGTLKGDPPKYVQEWFKKRLADGSKAKGYLKSPPGYDVGHQRALCLGGKNTFDNFRFELATMNRGRGLRERAIAVKWGLLPP